MSERHLDPAERAEEEAVLLAHRRMLERATAAVAEAVQTEDVEPLLEPHPCP